MKTNLETLLASIENHPGLISLLAGIFVPGIFFVIQFYNSRRSTKQRLRKIFTIFWGNPKNLSYEDISGHRKEYEEKNPSTQKHLPGEINNALDNFKNVLLIGESMSGKTYFTINFLKKLDNVLISVLNLKAFEEYYDSIIPHPNTNVQYKIILIDDFHQCSDWVKNNRCIIDFIEKANRDGYLIWINTIDSEEVTRTLLAPMINLFKTVTIPSEMPRGEALEIARSEGINHLSDSFDNNIGSIFYDTTIVRAKYDALDGSEKAILIAIKKLYLLGYYERPFRVVSKHVLDIINYPDGSINLSTLVEKIDKLIKVGLLRSGKSFDHINFEEKYIRIIVSPDLRIQDFIKFLPENFSSNVSSYTKAIKSASSYNEAKNIFDSMLKKNLQPNKVTYSMLIGKAPDYNTARNIFNEMLDQNIYLTQQEYGLLINISKDFAVGKGLLDEMIQKGIEPNRETYGTLINISKDFKLGKELFDEMIQNGIEPNREIYGTLINISKDFKLGKELFDEMIQKGIEPNRETYGTLINISKDFKLGKELFDEIIQKGIEPTAKEYGTLISISQDFTRGKELFDEMIRNGIEPTREIYGTLINISKDFTRGKELFDEMIQNGIEPNREIYGTLINISKDFTRGKELFDEMIQKGIEPTREIYGTLINISKDFTRGKELFDEMIRNGIKPTAKEYGTLISISKGFTRGKELFDEMIRNGIKPTIKEYGTLIHITNDYKKGEDLLNEMAEYGINPDVQFFNSIIRLCKKDYQLALGIVQYQMPLYNLSPDAYTFTQLMIISRDFKTAFNLLNEMIKKNLNPSDKTWDILRALAGRNNEWNSELDDLYKNWLEETFDTVGKTF